MAPPGADGTGACLLQLSAEASSLPLHLLPCSVQHNGPAPVSDYIHPKSTGIIPDGGAEVKETAFRGRRLVGATLGLPDGYLGFVLEKTAESNKKGGVEESEGKQQPDRWSTEGTFKELTYWNHDTTPNRTDAVPRAFDWLSLSQKIHEHVSSADVAAMLAKEGLAEVGAKRKSTT